LSPDHLQENVFDESPILLSETDAVRVLSTGLMEEQGLLPYSSNYSFLATVSDSASVSGAPIILPAVYKPKRGENPLWDFEWGTLCMREVAAYEISRLLGWHLVPPTILREGPHGIGSVQLYVHNDEDDHYFSVQADARYADAFRRMALLDYVINNADRKSGHCLVDYDHRIWAIDHGVCFGAEYKLRTVIWEYSGQRIEDDYVDDLKRLYAFMDDARSDATVTLQRLLSPIESLSIQERIARLTATGLYPGPVDSRRNYPWPPI